MTFSIRDIRQSDNEVLAKIIRDTLTEYKANKPGTVFFDDSTDHLSEVFKTTGSRYFVAENEKGKLIGGAGIFPTEGLPAGMCELVKMYLVPEARGKGLGKMLMQKCIDAASGLGFSCIYLETMPELKDAIRLYEKSGFRFIPNSIGESGHDGCDLFMLKYLHPEDEAPGLLQLLAI